MNQYPNEEYSYNDINKKHLNPNSIKNHELKNVLRFEAQKKSVKRNGKYRWKHAQAHLKNWLRVGWKWVENKADVKIMLQASITAVGGCIQAWKMFFLCLAFAYFRLKIKIDYVLGIRRSVIYR